MQRAKATRRDWRTFQGVLGEQPTSDGGTHTADNFAVLFRDKVEAVRNSTAATPHNVTHTAKPTISEWATVAVDEVQKLITALNKTCQLDPAHSWLVKDMCDLSPFPILLFNKSLDTGCLKTEFNQAVFRPLLKKNGLDDSELKSFRSVSNLSFISKLLEKIVQARIRAFFDSKGLMPMQFAYRRFYSTETAVTKVFSDHCCRQWSDVGSLSA